jgi:hypothetical protein
MVVRSISNIAKPSSHSQVFHRNSADALRDERNSGRISRRAQAILQVIGNGVFSDREILALLNLKDMNNVRPRITELIRSGHLIQVGSRIDRVTNKKVRLVAMRPQSVRFPADAGAPSAIQENLFDER